MALMGILTSLSSCNSLCLSAFTWFTELRFKERKRAIARLLTDFASFTFAQSIAIVQTDYD